MIGSNRDRILAKEPIIIPRGIATKVDKKKPIVTLVKLAAISLVKNPFRHNLTKASITSDGEGKNVESISEWVEKTNQQNKGTRIDKDIITQDKDLGISSAIRQNTVGFIPDIFC